MQPFSRSGPSPSVNFAVVANNSSRGASGSQRRTAEGDWAPLQQGCKGGETADLQQELVGQIYASTEPSAILTARHDRERAALKVF